MDVKLPNVPSSLTILLRNT